MTMIGRQSLEINHTRQPYQLPPTRIHLKQETPSGREQARTSALNNKSHLRENSPSRPRPTNLLSPKHQPDIRFSLETRPFQRETAVYKPRKPGHVPLSAACHIRRGRHKKRDLRPSWDGLGAEKIGGTTLTTLKGVIVKSLEAK